MLKSLTHKMIRKVLPIWFKIILLPLGRLLSSRVKHNSETTFTVTRPDWNIWPIAKKLSFVAYLQFFLETNRLQELIYALGLLKNFSVALFSTWQIDCIVLSVSNYWELRDVKNVQTVQKSIRGVSGKHNPEKPKISNALKFSW